MNIVSLIEIAFSLGLFVNALLFVPQIMRLVKEKHSGDLSLITFGGFCVMQIITVLHGFINQDYILAFGFLFTLITCGTVVTLIVYYRWKENKQNKSCFAS